MKSTRLSPTSRCTQRVKSLEEHANQEAVLRLSIYCFVCRPCSNEYDCKVDLLVV